ncbi:MAG: class I SAM-dependent methyltransferase [Deltaproteobacteria bacterium]|nr:MAG: class I SAM-dependent methyltransferase [Deltaproteobacteria bacterium]
MLFARKNRVRPEFSKFCSSSLYDMQVYRDWLDQIDRRLEKDDLGTAIEVQNLMIKEYYQHFKEFYQKQVDVLEDLVAGFTRQEHELHGYYFRKQFWDIILSSEMLRRTNLKPRGYAGDYVMMRMIYENRFRGRTVFEKFMHKFPLDTPAAQAVRNRRTIVAETARKLSEEKSGSLKVLSVACGPAWEVGDIVKAPEDAARYEFTLLDQDPLALEEAEAECKRVAKKIGRPVNFRTVRQSVRTMLASPEFKDQIGLHDMVYAMGLFDYLTGPVAPLVLQKMYELVTPGGVLLIGNYHPRNPTRIYMEYWADWVLYYRDEQKMMDLTGSISGCETDLRLEDAGCQLFLTVRKE